VVNITGGIANFMNGAGTFKIANNLCGNGANCFSPAGTTIKVLLENGAVAQNVSVTGPFKNAESATVDIGANAATIVVNGAATKVTISGAGGGGI
jgi:hypothetical protein